MQQPIPPSRAIALLQGGRINLNILIISLAIVLGLALSALLLHLSQKEHFSNLERVGNERLDLYASTVQAAHKRFDYLPFIVAGDQQVHQLLQGQGLPESNDNVNRKLEAWQQQARAIDLYLMNSRGRVVASSNWQLPHSFIGQDYHFRPYFKDAIEGRQGQFFAVGVTTGRPGLFLSRPVIVNEQVIGVAVIKIDMAELEQDWAAGGENIWVADQDGVIFLASDVRWRYKSLTKLPSATLERLKTEQKYSDNEVTPLPLKARKDSPQGRPIIDLQQPSGGRANNTKSTRYLIHHRQIQGLDWGLYYLSDLQPLSDSNKHVILIAGLVAALVAALGLVVANRLRHQQQLEQRVASRTQALNQSNRQLLQEINERTKAEEELRQTHEGLIQAEKLAAIGQLSAGLVHEISQPLSAMQTFIASTRLLVERGQTETALENINDINSMARRVSAIVSHLKTFASKSRDNRVRVELSKVVDNALLILNSRRSKSHVKLSWSAPTEPVYVKADEIKLEQVLVNLIRNGLDAIDSTDHSVDKNLSEPAGLLQIDLMIEDNKANLYIKDNGAGIDPEDLSKVFDPFFTTKDTGEGLGLGLSVSQGIARDFGGDLLVSDQPGGGTVFKLSLNAAQQPEDTDATQ